MISLHKAVSLLSCSPCRGAMKLFADFYEADIIVASPLAISTLLAEQKDAAGAADFLSSIEVCVVDRADVILMQNWTHLLTGAPCSPVLMRAAPRTSWACCPYA